MYLTFERLSDRKPHHVRMTQALVSALMRACDSALSTGLDQVAQIIRVRADGRVTIARMDGDYELADVLAVHALKGALAGRCNNMSYVPEMGDIDEEIRRLEEKEERVRERVRNRRSIAQRLRALAGPFSGDEDEYDDDDVNDSW